VITSLQ